ncbi:MAG: hypothetical protein CVU38_02965 [Chloroflexi bacterium HGW-Chloroflexi-1]|nr:MAG: hypothetical protein CVU38_02965 [Chloroflexi bacterium HGW-Chloroflexi-1]
MTIVELKQDITGIQSRLGWLEQTVRQLLGEQPASPPAPEEILDQEQLLAWMRAQGLIIEAPPEAREHAARWRTLSEADKQAVLWELDHLPPGPMASDLIIEGRR